MRTAFAVPLRAEVLLIFKVMSDVSEKPEYNAPMLAVEEIAVQICSNSHYRNRARLVSLPSRNAHPGATRKAILGKRRVRERIRQGIPFFCAPLEEGLYFIPFRQGRHIW